LNLEDFELMTTTTDIKFSDSALQQAQDILNQYPAEKSKSALLPLLHLAQAEFDGWLSAPVMDYVASILNIQPIEVYEVASFYSMFNLKPVGKYLIEVCQTSSCWMNGSRRYCSISKEKLFMRKQVKFQQMVCFKSKQLNASVHAARHQCSR
jgi:NADH-quinone oxidoreductase subunit E